MANLKLARTGKISRRQTCSGLFTQSESLDKKTCCAVIVKRLFVDLKGI
jgi:hypothetical protein